MTPAALIFDCDGTLADTMPLHWQAWQQVTQRYNLIFPEERFCQLGGVPSRDILKTLSQEQSRELDPQAVSKEKEAAYRVYMPQVRPVKRVVAIAAEHYGKLPMGVASGGVKPVVLDVLKHLKIDHFFQAVVTSEDVPRQKPAPDIFLEAARQLGVAPERCRAYEDTDLGLEAILAAGMEAVDVRLLPE
jgi:beta-phosphoglucomutase family hydrolase